MFSSALVFCLLVSRTLRKNYSTQDCIATYVSTTSSIETGSGPYPLVRSVWDCGISYPAVLCSAMWCGGDLEVSSSPLEGELTGSSWHSVVSSMRTMCPKRVGRRDWTITVSLDCPVILRTSSFQTNWCHLIPSSIRRHHWSNESIFLLSRLTSSLTHIRRYTECTCCTTSAIVFSLDGRVVFNEFNLNAQLPVFTCFRLYKLYYIHVSGLCALRVSASILVLDMH